MPWTVGKPPNPAKNKSKKEKQACVAAANAHIKRHPGDDEGAIFACIGAMKNVKKFTNGNEKILLPFIVKKVNEEKRLVYGEVYAPMVVDTHGEMMLPDDVELLAHRFVSLMKQHNIDVMHNNNKIDAFVVESFIAKNTTDYNEGAWVAVTKILDDDILNDIKSGKYNGYSLEAIVKKQRALVEIETYPTAFGITEKTDGHDHIFYIELDEMGRIVRGHTSIDHGHKHDIMFASATDESESHSHRYFLP